MTMLIHIIVVSFVGEFTNTIILLSLRYNIVALHQLLEQYPFLVMKLAALTLFGFLYNTCHFLSNVYNLFYHLVIRVVLTASYQ